VAGGGGPKWKTLVLYCLKRGNPQIRTESVLGKGGYGEELGGEGVEGDVGGGWRRESVGGGGGGGDERKVEEIGMG